MDGLFVILAALIKLSGSNLNYCCRLRVVPLSLSPLCMTREKNACVRTPGDKHGKVSGILRVSRSHFFVSVY